MSFITTIRRGAIKFHAQLGKKPTRIYLTNDAWYGLARELQTLGFTDVSPLHMPDPASRFDGMHITLTMRAGRHVGFSYDDEDEA